MLVAKVNMEMMNGVMSVVNTTRGGLPLYRQVEEYLREQIASGSLASGDMLPSVRELCEQFGGINHLTVRQAIKNLSEDNLVRSVQGRGSFVTGQTSRDQRIALVLPHLEDALFIQIAKGAQEALEEAGIRSLILDSRGSGATEADHIHSLKNLPLAGALIFPIARSDIAEQIFQLKIDGFPFVLVDRYFEDIAMPCVLVDNYDGGYQSAKYLAEKGRRHVAWLGELGSTAARQRLAGVRAALNDHHIACPNALIKSIEIPPDAPSSYHQAQRSLVRAALDELLDESRIDALICCDDPSALIALERLQERGVRVPEDVALFGFDDIPEAALSTPPLSTVRQPMLQMGRDAALMLAERMANKDLPAEKKVLPIELIIRQTA
jgi:DNA-binding LacI/PurR family transcriptional regulator